MTSKKATITFCTIIPLILSLGIVPALPLANAGELYSLSHFSVKGTVSESGLLAGKKMWTIIDGNEGTLVRGSPDGIHIYRLDVKPYHTCYDDAKVICLDVTITGGKNMQFAKIGDTAVLVFNMPQTQKISIMSGELETLGIDLDIEKFHFRTVEEIVEEHKQNVEIDNLKQETIIKLEEALQLIAEPSIIQTLVESNAEFDAMDDPYEVIDQRNDEWVEAGKEVTPFMGSLLGNKVSEILRNVILEDKENNFPYVEIFLTNSYGANVAQSGKTSDYKQWDEQWWIQSKQNGVNFDTGYDESAGVNALDMSVRITDDSGKFLGIMKFVINIESLS